MLSLLSAVAGTASAEIHGFALGAGTGVEVVMTESPYFPLKAQLRVFAQLVTEFPIAGPLGMGLSLGYHGVGPSAAAAGFVYRGHAGLDTGLHLFVRGLMTTGIVDLFGGVRSGVEANFDEYNLTQLLFFYPSLLVEPYLEFHFPPLGAHTFSLGLPVHWYFRKDLNVSPAIGLGLTWRWYPGQRGKPE